ncbi:MAG: hypothetical protein AABY22_06395 [Nanoarchaeota archaeon]
MSKNRDLLKEAIADAKSVKDTAIANAKLALEEAFTPYLKEKLAAKLSEMDNEEEIDEVENTTEIEEVETEVTENEESETEETEEVSEEFSLDELLAELEEGEETLNENEETEVTEVETEETEEEVSIEDMSSDDLKKFVEDVIKDMKASGELEEVPETEESEETESEEEVELDENLEETEEIEEGTFGAGMADMSTVEALISMLSAAGLVTGVALHSFKDEIKKYFKDKKEISTAELGKMVKAAKEGSTTTDESVNVDLQEAYDAIKTLKNEMSDINLLNAKLLYTNKIFRNKNLTEAQKIKVLTSFDKAKNKNEAKLVYETLKEEIKPSIFTKPSSLKESLGSASKTIISSSNIKKPIIENNAFTRMQELAFGKKQN